MSKPGDSILIFAGEPLAAPLTEPRRGLRDRIESAATTASSVAVDTLQDNVRRFLSSLDTILGGSPKEVGGLTVEEVEVHVQIDAKGNVGLSGVAGGEIAAQGGIKFVLRRKV